VVSVARPARNSDRVFEIDGARRVFDWAPSQRKLFTEFPDGDHCLSNRSHENHTLIADWLADQLL
jgi:hypothetical protein